MLYVTALYNCDMPLHWHLKSLSIFSGIRVVQSLVFCVVHSLSFFLLAIELTFLPPFTSSDLFGIFKLLVPCYVPLIGILPCIVPYGVISNWYFTMYYICISLTSISTLTFPLINIEHLDCFLYLTG